MLGQLFSSLGPSFRKLSRPQEPTEAYEAPLSVTEDSHTRSLLFPDPDILSRSHSEPYPLQGNTAESVTAAYGAIYDNWNTEVGIDGSRDIRILIARDELGRLPKTILYDSSSSTPTSPAFDRDSLASKGSDAKDISEPRSPRWTGSIPSPTSPSFQRGPLNRRTHGRTGSTGLSSVYTPSPEQPGTGSFYWNRLRGSSISSIPEYDTQRLKRDAKDAEEEMGVYMDCMFGNTAPSYRGPSMKMHILPPRRSTASPSGLTSPRRNHTMQDSPSNRTTSHAVRQQDSQNVVLVTRTFSLPRNENKSTEGDMKPPPIYGQDGNLQFQISGLVSPNPSAKSSSTQQRVLFYAVAMAIRMTSGSPSLQTSPLQMERKRPPTMPYSPDRSPITPDSYAKNTESMNWRVGDEYEPTTAFELIDDFVTEIVTRHWDVISRTLFSLQYSIQGDIIQAQAKNPIGRLIDVLHTEEISAIAKTSIARVADAINTARVATGQGRWGIWRDEARMINRWAHAQHQDQFFFSLISAFLANHKEWMELIADIPYKRRNLRRHKPERSTENMTLPSRTIIVSRDKMTCRRLVFLLSSFLPTYRSYHPILSSPTSLKALSEAPYPLKSKSLRSNTELSEGGSSLPNGSYESRGYLSPRGLLSRDGSDEINPRHADVGGGTLVEGVTIASLLQTESSRKPTSERARRTSAVTISSTAPGATIPVAHFIPPSTRKGSQVLPDLRRTSSSSQASAKLLQNLQLNQNMSDASDSTSKPLLRHDLRRPDDGTEAAIHSPGSESPPKPPRRSFGSNSILGSSADSGGRRLQNLYRENDLGTSVTNSPTSPIRPRVAFGGALIPFSKQDQPLQQVLDRPRSSGLQFKMSVNEKDGIIDVDIPFTDFGSPLSSSSLAWADASSWDSKSQTSLSSFVYSTVNSQPQPLRVAGWLRSFHQDWHLQAVKPYDELEDDIKNAMVAEPMPPQVAEPKSFEDEPADEWVDICSTVIADCDSFRVRRLRLRRLFRYVSPGSDQMALPSSAAQPLHEASVASAQKTASNLIPKQIREEIVEESLAEPDEALVQAIVRVLAQSQPSSQPVSGRPSPANSVNGGSGDQTTERTPEPRPEVPRRECERLLMGSLYRVIKDAITIVAKQNDSSQGASEQEEEDIATFTLHDQVIRWLKEFEYS